MAYRSVLERHAEDAAALWTRRETASRAEGVSLGELAHLDHRVEAHLDGLRVAGRAGSAVAGELDPDEAGAVFLRAAQALETRDAKALASLLDHLESKQEAVPGLIGALGWIPLAHSAWAVRAMLHDRCPPPLRRFGLTAHVAQRSDPGRPLLDALGATSDQLRATALDGAGLLGLRELLPDVMVDIDHPSSTCRLAARLAAALLGEPSAVELLWEQAAIPTPKGHAALVVAVAKSPGARALSALRRWRADARRRRAALEGLALLGDPACMPDLLEDMRDPLLARLAGKAFSRLTGIAIAGALEGAPLEGADQGPTDDPNDEDVEPDPDANLAWPSADAIEASWKQRRGEFVVGRRHLLGEPLDDAHLRRVLGAGTQRLRYELAFERAARTPGAGVMDVLAPGFRQIASLA